MSTISEDESRRVQEFIETHFKEDTDLQDCPWQAMKIDGMEADVNLKKQYNTG